MTPWLLFQYVVAIMAGLGAGAALAVLAFHFVTSMFE